MSNSITPVISSNLQTSITGLISRLLDQAGLSTEEVNQLITDYVTDIRATDLEAQSAEGEGLVSTSQAKMVASATIDEWVGAAPGALDTLKEIADALQSNPDVITEILASLATKASIEYVDSKVTGLGVISGVDFNESAYDGLLNQNDANVNSMGPGKYLGSATVARLELAGADVIADVITATPGDLRVNVEADVVRSGVMVIATADSSDASGLGQSSFSVDHGSLPVRVTIGGEVSYDPANPSEGTAPNVSVVGTVTLAEYVPAGTSVEFMVYNPASDAEGTPFNNVTIRAYISGRTFQTDIDGADLSYPSAVWQSPSMGIEELAQLLTASFNAEAKA